MKKTVKFLPVFLLALLLTACTGSHEGHKGMDGSGTAASAETRYSCPMHPQIVKHAPGECPICGMDLVPVISGGEVSEKTATTPKGHANINLSLERQQLIGVKTSKVVKKNLFRTIRAPDRWLSIRNCTRHRLSTRRPSVRDSG